MWPALPSRPSSSLPSSTMPPPTPVETTMAMKSVQPAAAPTHPSPSANALASLSTNVGSPVNSARRARSGNDRHPAMFRGDTSSPPGLIGPPHPAPQTTRRSAGPTSAVTPSHQAGQVAPQSFGVVGTRRGRRRAASPVPAGSRRAPTSPAAILVPPMSTASARSATGGVLPRPGSEPRHATTPDQRGWRRPDAVLSLRAGGSGSGTSRGRRSRRSRSRWSPRRPSVPRPWTASGRATPPGPSGAGCARTTRPRRT